MAQVTLGRTGITVGKNGFGALPIQRISREEAVRILRKAYDNGITFFDTARMYTDSEEKLGAAFKGLRDRIILATKTMSVTVEGFWKDLEKSLSELGTDYVDILQFHNPPFCPRPGDGSGLYEAMTEAKKQGKIRFIGLTNHLLPIAGEAAGSGLYDTLQFPFSYLSAGQDLEIVQACKERNVGFIAMKALSGGLITNAAAAYAYLEQFDHVLPIWGIQRERELDEFLSFAKRPPILDEEMAALIRADREELSGNFCRGCGYCLPCPAEIDIPNSARMSLLIRRSPSEQHLTEAARAVMRRIDDCAHCGQCAARCPYGLNPPLLLEENYKDYREILEGKAL